MLNEFQRYYVFDCYFYCFSYRGFNVLVELSKNKRDELRQTLKIVEKDRDYWRKRAIEAEKKLAKEDEK